ncbi:hypothetical protein JCM16303_006966 [Sporobolomyces ruberrimus]
MPSEIPRSGLLTPSAFDSPTSNCLDQSSRDLSSQSSSYSRRPSTTTIPMSELSSRRASLNFAPNDQDDYSNSAYASPSSTAPLLNRNIPRSRAKVNEPTKWSRDPREWRKLTWVKLLVWATPLFLLFCILLRQRAHIGPSRETVSKLRKQIDSILHSSSSMTMTCPSPLKGRPTTSFDDPNTLSPFEPIRSKHSGFSLAISYSKKTCNSFRIRISRNNPAVCLQNLQKPEELNEDRETVEWIKKLGPDTFQLRVDGAERYVVDEPSRYDPERCEYYFDFPLSNPGTVWLNGIHFYENYDAYNSQPRHEIERLLSPLFATPLELSLCPCSTCSQLVPPLLGSHRESFVAGVDRSSPQEAIPICSSRSPIPGSYIPSAYPSLLYPPFQLPQTSKRPSAGFHTFVPSECVYFHDGLRFRDHSWCLEEENKVLFIGDSHTRGLYDVVLKRLSGSDEMALTSFKVANKKERIGNLHLEFLWDPFLEATFDCSYMSQFTHVVVSTGSHQACYRCPATTSYISHMSSIFSSWPERHSTCQEGDDVKRKKEAKFVFVTSPSWYPQKIERYDCRTSQRLTRWNELSTKEALKEGWSVVDAQALTRSMAVDTRLIDGVHFIKTDAIDPMVDELIEKLGICV